MVQMPSGNRETVKTAGIIGLGVGMQHVLAYQSLGLDVLVCDFNAELARPADVLDIDDWRELIDRSDIVSICSWDQYHEEQAIYALERDKHVLCEKPLAHTRESLERIRAAAEKSRGILDVSFPLRYKLSRFGLWDKTKSATFSYHWGRNQKLHDGWRRNTPDYNVTCGGLIHMIDLCEQMVGKIDNNSIHVRFCGNIKSVGIVDYDEIDCYCTIGGASVFFEGYFSDTNGRHRNLISLGGDGLFIDVSNISSDKGAPVRHFYNAVTHPTIKFTPDPFSANLTAIAVHEKAMEYLRG